MDTPERIRHAYKVFAEAHGIGETTMKDYERFRERTEPEDEARQFIAELAERYPLDREQTLAEVDGMLGAMIDALDAMDGEVRPT